MGMWLQRPRVTSQSPHGKALCPMYSAWSLAQGLWPPQEGAACPAHGHGHQDLSRHPCCVCSYVRRPPHSPQGAWGVCGLHFKILQEFSDPGLDVPVQLVTPTHPFGFTRLHQRVEKDRIFSHLRFSMLVLNFRARPDDFSNFTNDVSESLNVVAPLPRVAAGFFVFNDSLRI